MSSKWRTHSNYDKWDGYMPNKPSWIQDDYDISAHNEYFHIPVGWAYKRHHDGRQFGTQKKMYEASSHGINIDSIHVGKSDAL